MMKSTIVFILCSMFMVSFVGAPDPVSANPNGEGILNIFYNPKLMETDLENFKEIGEDSERISSVILDGYSVEKMSPELRERVMKSFREKQDKGDLEAEYDWAVLRQMSQQLLQRVLRKAIEDNQRPVPNQSILEDQFKKNDIVGSFIETCIDGQSTFNYDYLRPTYVTDDKISPAPIKNIVLHLRPMEISDKYED